MTRSFHREPGPKHVPKFLLFVPFDFCFAVVVKYYFLIVYSNKEQRKTTSDDERQKEFKKTSFPSCSCREDERANLDFARFD
jgi:hypothetical protein